MGTFEIIIISGLIGGSIFLAVLISILRQVGSIFFAPYPYYSVMRRPVETDDSKRGDKPTRAYLTMTLVVIMIIWMMALHKSEGQFEPPTSELNAVNSVVPSSMITLPDMMEEEKEVHLAKAVAKKDISDQYFVQFAAIVNEQFATETQQRLSTSLNREVIIQKERTWHFLLVGPFDNVEDAKEYAKSKSLETLIKSANEFGV